MSDLEPPSYPKEGMIQAKTGFLAPWLGAPSIWSKKGDGLIPVYPRSPERTPIVEVRPPLDPLTGVLRRRRVPPGTRRLGDALHYLIQAIDDEIGVVTGQTHGGFDAQDVAE